MKRLTLLVLFLLFVPLARAACSHEDAPYELKQSDPAYEQATNLKRTFERQGIEVDVMFMPESVDFRVHVVETKKDGRYLYTFEGKPHANTPVWDSNRPSTSFKFTT